MMLDNQVVLISGAAGKIGSSFTTAVAEAGGRVVVGDLNQEKGQEIAKSIGANNALFVKMDTTDPKSIWDGIVEGQKAFGPINSAVHCAYPRSIGWGTTFEDLDPQYLNEDLSLQLGGAITFSQQVIKAFRSNGYGNLIHVSSIQGVSAPKFEHYEGTGMVSPIEYSAIKAGVIAISKYIAKYLKNQNIRSNCISPGGILDNQPQMFLEKYRNSCSSKGMLEPYDLSQALVFLLSDHSRFINGQNIIVDDGWSL